MICWHKRLKILFFQRPTGHRGGAPFCPMIVPDEELSIPSGVSKNISVKVENLPVKKIDFSYCRLCNVLIMIKDF